jgi:cytochrome c oxidase cbb3-type subunit 2
MSAALATSAVPVTAQNAQKAPGGELYQKLCSQCHGEKGDGQGVAAGHLLPRPRDFTAGKFKIRHTPSGALPTDDDLRHIIREGMPYTSMPAWKQLSDGQISELVTAVKSFSPDFASPEKRPKPITIPKAPDFSEESAKKGKEVYASIGCAACHGEVGRGDGPSALTLTDDWGHPIRPADLTKRWTFRGGPTREDIYRTFTTGLNGTPMPSFAESLSDAQRWQLVDYINSLDPRDSPGYSDLLQVQFIPDEIDLQKGKALFANAPAAYFPVVGQITEPGRAFHPTVNGVTVRAVYNAREIGFLVTWHDPRADVSGKNAPDMVVPPEEDNPESAATSAAGAAGGSDESGDVWGGQEEAAPAATPTPAEAGGEGGDFWGAEENGAAPGAPAGGEFSDAIAIQLPAALPSGSRKPYFIFGDASNPVDLWFMDLASKAATRYNGTGSKSLSVVEGEDVSGVASYDRGEWSVIFKRELRGNGSVSFAESQFVPIAFSFWDGSQSERGNKRGLTRWMYLYMMPRETPSMVWPMVRTALLVLAAELLLIYWIRRRQSQAAQAAQARQAEKEVPLHV